MLLDNGITFLLIKLVRLKLTTGQYTVNCIVYGSVTLLQKRNERI